RGRRGSTTGARPPGERPSSAAPPAAAIDHVLVITTADGFSRASQGATGRSRRSLAHTAATVERRRRLRTPRPEGSAVVLTLADQRAGGGPRPTRASRRPWTIRTPSVPPGHTSPRATFWRAGGAPDRQMSPLGDRMDRP